MSLSDAEVAALVATWRMRAATYRRESQESQNIGDIYRFAGVASSWKFGARELSECAGIPANAAPHVANTEAERAQRGTDIQLARDALESKP